MADNSLASKAAFDAAQAASKALQYASTAATHATRAADSARAAAASAAGTSVGGTFGQRVFFTGNSLLISGLDGNAKGEYEIEMWLVNASAQSWDLTALPNSSTDDVNMIANGGDGTDPYTFKYPNSYVGSTLMGGSCYTKFRFTCFSGSPRIFAGDLVAYDTAGDILWKESFTNKWADTSSNLTEILFQERSTGPLANMFGSGSWYRIRAIS